MITSLPLLQCKMPFQTSDIGSGLNGKSVIYSPGVIGLQFAAFKFIVTQIRGKLFPVLRYYSVLTDFFF